MADSNNKRKERSGGSGRDARDARDGDNRGGKRAKVCGFPV